MSHSLTFRVLDFDHKLMNNDYSSILILKSSVEGSSLTGDTQIVARGGEFVFTDLVFQGTPLTQQGFTITQSFIDPVLVGQALKDPEYDFKQELNATFRDCIAGEVKLNNK